ncbi:hypothetical protein TTHERM_00419920 (macronuclear) [Tetrahymena thermophila SB210]|uniref:Uncharacterized protein n=1 Tax=Tetrahymena thermophila (strain SB210) TaxID=312017 RepID=I7LTN9_TETTS|nr:hypothetical protein TTHERM_00419920 [Tetrahymena thermophila SB210]EAR85584.2 hypothetical protein TTHERM_00419920 [Tetrahymena thermophila SB210]|eukprot:XP_001033247.2 hypothetical protein TTHERM_00419920 [Tetrahymena thermophila SB210]
MQQNSQNTNVTTQNPSTNLTPQQANQRINTENQKQQVETKWNIQLDQNEKEYIIVIGHMNFPTLLDYSKLNLANKKIQHLIISDMYFQFQEKQIKITFSKAGLGDLNPYKVLYNIYEKIYCHFENIQKGRSDFTKNLDIYPQVVHYLGTPISFEIFFRFNSYKYANDNKLKEEWIRVSNILSYDIYDEVRHDYEGNTQGYDIQQQTHSESDLDSYMKFQHMFKKNLFYGLFSHFKLEQIYHALEVQYVPYFIIQKIFLQLEDFYMTQYQLTVQEIQPLRKMVDDITMFPSFQCILFTPHNTQKKQRSNNDKFMAEKLESRSFMQIRFDLCPNCQKFIKETTRRCLDLKEDYLKALQNLQSTDPTNAQKQKLLYDKLQDSLSQLKVACKNTNLPHQYWLKISFCDLFYYFHQQQRGQDFAYGIDKRGQIQECLLRSFDVFEKVFAKYKNSEEQLRFNHEKQQISFCYINQVELELSLLTFLSLVYQLHFIYQYYYFFSQRLTNQQQVEIKYHETNLKQGNIIMVISQQNSPFELQLYVEYEKQGLVVFNTHIRSIENRNSHSQTYIQLQSWMYRIFCMTSYMKAEVAYTFLNKGNRLISWLQRDENKSRKIISLYQDLLSLNLSIFNIDLTSYDEEDQNMKDYVRNSNASEDMFKKLLEINFDIDKKNQLVIYKEGQYAFFFYQTDSSNQRILQNKEYNPSLNIFSDSAQSILQFLRSVV